MPWKETCPMDQRMEFVIQHRSGTISMAALCRLFGVSRQTGHKWVNRFSPRRGEVSLEELSRRSPPQPDSDAQAPRREDRRSAQAVSHLGRSQDSRAAAAA